MFSSMLSPSGDGNPEAEPPGMADYPKRCAQRSAQCFPQAGTETRLQALDHLESQALQTRLLRGLQGSAQCFPQAGTETPKTHALVFSKEVKVFGISIVEECRKLKKKLELWGV
jgi:hypothetical protein